MTSAVYNSSRQAAFLFPGQGSQAPGMGKFLFENFPIAKHIFEESSDALSVDMKKLCFESDEKTLALTENTQPALLTVSSAAAQVVKNHFVDASHAAGHSVGEYAAFVLGGALDFKDAVRAVRFRGQAMQSAVPIGEGGMTATLGLTEAHVLFLCEWAVAQSGFGPLSPANFNCDGQIVVSGNARALQWLKENFKAELFSENNLGEARRAKLISLQVSAPFHCPMMKPAEENMRRFLDEIKLRDSNIPIIQNFNAEVQTQAALLKENIIRQISAPVLWTQSMATLKASGQSRVIECGHGNVLKGLLKKIDADFFQVYSVNSMDDLLALEDLS